TAGSGGGGIGAEGGGSFTLFGDTLNGNKANNTGGGFDDRGGDTNTFVNTTVVGNQSTFSGGGIFSGNGSETISFSTITGNRSVCETGNLATSEAGHITLDDTIVAGGIGGTCGARAAGTKDSHDKQVDQRQIVRRRQGAGCDIGAFEATPDLGINASAAKHSIFVNQQDTVTDTIVNTGPTGALGSTFTDPAAGYQIDS